MYAADSNRKVVSHCHIDDANKTLGVILAPDANSAKHGTIMRDLALKFGDKTRAGFINDNGVM